jgi:hypothetical protein
MINLTIGILIYMTIGAICTLALETYLYIIHKIREALDLGSCNHCQPTPKMALIFGLMIGIPLDILFWPINLIHTYLKHVDRA